MTNKIHISLSLLYSIHLFAIGQINMQYNIDELINSSELKSASVGIFAKDLATNKIILDVNSGKGLCPASVLKISTTIAALEIFGENFTFKTKVGTNGKVIADELIGDLIIIGNGDPTFGSEYFGNKPEKIFAEIIMAIKAKGIKKIIGKIIVDDSFFDCQPVLPKWIYEDFGNYYGAGTFGLNWRDNAYSLFLNSTEKNIVIEKMDPLIVDCQFDNQLKAADNNKDSAFIYGEPYDYQKKITGTIPGRQTKFEIRGAMPDPALQFAKELKNYLQKNDVVITENSTTTRLIKIVTNGYKLPPTINILEIASPPLKEIIAHVNINSDNVYAESLLKLMDTVSVGIRSSKGGIETTMRFWKDKKVNTEGINLEDGSGLSRFNNITPINIVSMLQYIYGSKNRKIFINSLPVAGVSGGMKNIGKNSIAENNVFAKTGYMTRVRSYAGFMNTKSEKQIAFSIIVNNYSCSAAEAKLKCEQIMMALIEY